QGVEIFENDLLTYDGGNARDVGRLIRDLGLTCTVFQPFRDFEGMPDPQRQRVFDRMERKFDVMQELGTQLLLVCSNVSPAASADRNRVIADFSELGERAQKRGLRVGYEALAWGRHVFDHRDAWAIVRDTNHPSIGIILDTFHSLARRVPIESLPDIDVKKIFMVQLADAPALEMDVLSWSRHFRSLPGQGDLNVTDYVAALRRRGYDGVWSLEIFNDRFRASPASTTAVDGMRSLRFLDDQVSRRLGENELPMPDRARASGFAFVEFAANEEEVEPLSRMFKALGFTLAGRHRSKDVTRWNQNGINFVINSEPESFARAYDSVHGASVCALGIAVDDVETAMRRAQALQIGSFSQPVGPGELQMPSVRGVGGSLLYFMRAGDERRIWEHEFTSIVTAEGKGAGLKHVDYVAQTMQYEEMLSWLLYYLALFDVSKTPQIEVADPLGLVYSQAVESPQRDFRITLNSSAAAQTLSSRFLQGFLGAGVQHIALATEDIFATARQLKSLGLETLPIPANYYEDVQARFGIDDAMCDRLASYNVLYDREGEGEYFHLYSRAFAKRFFFEIVERRNYAAYGAANAPIRLAAQSRYRSDRA
ncbi:MAG TPA: TIM barrel protein, partial [Steroidobacteraceae bacterium]|nr:TIM barrel protein [Steroidobacteraceae bacterium]